MASQSVTYDNSDHIMRTTSQWADRAIANWPIPRGLLCIEILTDSTTKLKIGEGDKFYRQLPYVGTNGGGDWSNYYTKQQIDTIIRNMNYMSIASTDIYESKERLPSTGNRMGDVRFVRNQQNPLGDPLEYMWNGSRWIPLGGSISGADLSAYAKKAEVNPRLDALERVAHSHANKTILDRVTAPYTAEEKQKLAGLSNYDDTEIKHEITELETAKHTHANIDLLNATTAAFTAADQTKLDNLQNYEPFIGTNGRIPGREGLVPAPATTDTNKYLASDGTWKTIAAGGLQPATRSTLGGVIVGSGLDVDSDGVLSTTGQPSETSYVAGNGISIDEGSTSTDITNIQWTQGSINPANGQPDDLTSTAIRSPEIEVGLTSMLNVSAQDDGYHDMMWKAAFYDSQHQFIKMSDSWQTISGDAIKPENAVYFILVLRKEPETTIDETNLLACEISWPIEISKYVITNTGVTHLETRGNAVIAVEDGETKNVLTFTQDLLVSDGSVSIPDYNDLVLHGHARNS